MVAQVIRSSVIITHDHRRHEEGPMPSLGCQVSRPGLARYKTDMAATWLKQETEANVPKRRLLTPDHRLPSRAISGLVLSPGTQTSRTGQELVEPVGAVRALTGSYEM